MDGGNRHLSGGQKNRLGLARLLLAEPDVLLLDEPTNHLDVAAVEWLEEFLASYKAAYIIISHDRYFLDRACTRIVEVENGRAVSYTGNYSAFLVERDERREAQQRAYDNQQHLIAKTEEFIRRNLAGQKTKQAKSRRKMLEKLERVDAVRPDQSSGDFRLKKVERAGTHVLTAEKASIGYPSNLLASDITFTLRRGECLGLIGPNGSGKTTFVKTVLDKLPPLAGDVRWGSNVQIGYYAQQLDDLDDRNEIIMELRRVAPASATAGELRTFLAKFLFTGDDVYKHVRDLSGGEKGRLALAKLSTRASTSSSSTSRRTTSTSLRANPSKKRSTPTTARSSRSATTATSSTASPHKSSPSTARADPSTTKATTPSITTGRQHERQKAGRLSGVNRKETRRRQQKRPPRRRRLIRAEARGESRKAAVAKTRRNLKRASRK